MKVIYGLLILMIAGCGSNEKKETRTPFMNTQPFVKGVYGNPATLLNAGYRFDSLGMNAVFVRSQSLNPQFYKTALDQGCQVYLEFPTLNGKPYLDDHPEAWPINEKGKKAP